MKKEITEKIDAFRKEVTKIMPGYKWTIKKPSFDDGRYLEALGTISAGFNRISTLLVIRNEKDGCGTCINYTAKSSGYGLHSPWLSVNKDYTLARALRGLQDHYERMANEYRTAANHLKESRTKPLKDYAA